MNGGIATKTLAELYLSQGDLRKALEIYREVLKREPSNTEIREAITKLQRETAQPVQSHIADRPQDLSAMEKIRSLENWQEKIRIIRKQRQSKETR